MTKRPNMGPMLIMTVFGLGRLKPAPGTWGSLPPCAIALLLVWCGLPIWAIGCIMIAIVIVSSVGCVALGEWAEKKYKGKDPGCVVIDETAGMALTLAFVPLSLPIIDPLLSQDHWAAGFIGWVIVIGAAFLIFRILDIVKVPPANAMQQFPAGWGILIDDLIVAVYGNIILQIALRFAIPAMT